ncbi:hypothetical protein VDGE_30212 [Verticillium dahliae]|uniref:Uncharacterized protein n=1 Tax=Verticillium dahliae TaxID=27337 RepID=A0A444RN57_VERDA|nr:hypothetical protein VDGE_30212 [Verticillium dahliae]
MPAYEPPMISHEMRVLWVRTAKPGFQDSEKLYQKYWYDYNTVTIPLRDMDDFFADAITAASVAQDRDHLETLLAEQRETRWRELKEATRDIALATIYRTEFWPSRVVKDSALDAVRTGSLGNFLQFISCAMTSWKGVHVRDENDEKSQPSHRKERPAGGINGNGYGPCQDDDEDYETDFEDEYAYENNRVYPSDSIAKTFGQQDDAWNARAKADRAFEVEEVDGTPPARQLAQASPAGTTLVREAESRENTTVAEQISDTFQKNDAPALSTSPQAMMTDDASPPPPPPPPSHSSKDTSDIASPGPSHTKTTPPQTSPKLSNTEAADEARQSTESILPPDAGAKPGSPARRTSSAAGSVSARKRSLPKDDAVNGESNDFKRRKPDEYETAG